MTKAAVRATATANCLPGSIAVNLDDPCFPPGQIDSLMTMDLPVHDLRDRRRQCCATYFEAEHLKRRAPFPTGLHR